MADDFDPNDPTKGKSSRISNRSRRRTLSRSKEEGPSASELVQREKEARNFDRPAGADVVKTLMDAYGNGCGSLDATA